MKVFTATLVIRVAGQLNRWRDDNLLSALFEDASSAPQALRGIRMRHLLNHTHGLDASLAWPLPRRANGFIDSFKLCTMLAANPSLAPPGELQSYSSSGAWLWAAALERATKQRFKQLFFERLLEPLGLSSVPQDSGEICPAGLSTTSELPLSMSVNDLLAFLEYHMNSGASEMECLRRDVLPLPGWAAGEQGVCQGWKYFGSGWFGHTSILPEYSSLIRINPAARLGIVLGGAKTQLFSTFARLFARALPELTHVLLPGRFVKISADAVNFAAYEGRYVTAASTVRIDIASTQILRHQVTSRSSSTESQSSEVISLRHAGNHLFFPARQTNFDLPFVEFVSPRSNGTFEYIWNGKSLWRRDETAM
jgi:CubicO group peptidase (beta-lactamase class C family)